MIDSVIYAILALLLLLLFFLYLLLRRTVTGFKEGLENSRGDR